MAWMPYMEGLRTLRAKKQATPTRMELRAPAALALRPVQAQQQGPEEGGFQTTKGKQVDPDQQVRRLQAP